MHTASGLGNGGFGREPAGEFGKRQFRAVAGGRRQDLPGGVLVVVGAHDFLEGHDMRRGQGGDVIFADPPGFIDPDVEVLGGVCSGKSPMNTVWDLISPVSPFSNSAFTYSGAE